MTARPDLPAAFRKTMQFLEARRFPAVLIGGLAASLQGDPRTTADVDLMVAIPSSEIQNLARAAQQDGFTVEPELARTQWLASGFARLWVGPERTGVPIDLMACNSTFLKELAWRAQQTRLWGQRVRVAAPEDLLLLKAAAWRAKDIADVRGIFARHEHKLDRGHLDRWALTMASQNAYFAPVPERISALLERRPLPPPVSE
ncbi:MAG: nucleotidyltransferase [Planctomycetes bacterium]|nr:nucleotidyltransferase [Planctomycetota bacterium]